MDNHLKASLQDLQGKLAVAGPVDEELKSLLLRLDGDIQSLLARRQGMAAAAPAVAGVATVPAAINPVPEVEESTTYGLAERTQEISAKFAAQHPTLEPALRELGRILSNMGI
ncbi:hypothetical protein ASF61_17615 [Duganella sp. Leaf126]|uniref:DUF4404 family protein n=1 Tax=Duganella sp. Leaf126 TaxID=1736266 RepID=UPI0006FB78F0|nr:DUF4404 family protein [Duganella sp. Leaf126]KQQ31045.1 hypothetical protein ASF61_17615 [Duganella sp. Leaf126]